MVILLRRSPNKGPIKESGKTRVYLPKGVIPLQALLSIFVLTNSQEFNSLVDNSAELDRKNESTALRNISNER